MKNQNDGASDGALKNGNVGALGAAHGSPPFLAVSWGGGTNSTAMLCGLVERGVKPDLVMFADTGSEMPQTYEHLAMMHAQVQAWWGQPLCVVRKLREGKFEGVENECLRGAKLPALAYGSRACSVKYKHEPQNRMMKARMKERGMKIGTRAKPTASGPQPTNGQ